MSKNEIGNSVIAGLKEGKIEHMFNENLISENEITDWIYSVLQDEESKFIFENRKKFNDTGDYRYIDVIIDKYVSQFSGRKYYPGKEKLLINLIRETKKNVIIYGAGVRGKRLLNLFEKEGEGGKVKYFCDSNCNLRNSQVMGDVPFVSIQELADKKLYYDCVVVISPMFHFEEIREILLSYNCPPSNIYIYADYVDLFSKEQYFDKNIIHFEDNEVFIDGGCYDLESSRKLLERMCETGKKCKKIYAFEPDDKNLEKCYSTIQKIDFKNIELIHAGMWSENSFVEFDARGDSSSRIVSPNREDNKIKVIALDSYCKEKVTFIKMDIEGAELEALKGAKSILQRYRPKLAISIYHKKEDLWEIPYYIKSVVPEYKLYIRHYSNNSNELVLYAVTD